MRNYTLRHKWAIVPAIVMLGLADGVGTGAIAQVTDREQQQPLPTEPLPPLDDILEDIPTPRPDLPQLPAFTGTIPVKGFQVVGSTVFKAENLKKVLEEFTNQNLSFNQLLAAEEKIDQLYLKEGYINSGAVIPAQEIADGIVTIQVIEGSLEDIEVRVISGRINPNYVRSRLAKASKPLNRDRLQEALQLLQLDPSIENINAELSVGSRRERWILSVRVTAAPAFKPQIFADNARNPSVGSFQRGTQLNYHLLGLGDSIGFNYTNTDGSNEFQGSYSLPVNPSDGTISFRYRTIDSDIIEPPFDDLDLKSNSRTYELTYRQPIVRNATTNFTEELALGLTASRQESDTTLLGEKFPLSPGADDDGATRISALRFFQEWSKRDRRQVIAARSQFSLGVGAFDATINEVEPDSRFFVWRGQVQYLRQLGRDTTLLLRSDVQLSTTSLLSLEQFGLGGIQSVRGYRQDALLADNGFFASAELRLPILRWRQADAVLSFTPFVDFGAVGNKDRDNPDDNTLVSVGFGLLWQMGDRLRARVDWGIPLVDIDRRYRTWQENGVYFSIEFNP
ncbi:MAG: ShlB/FhaC/HecB family hemolysin secretion/activation protein [Hormoscilla sp.]